MLRSLSRMIGILTVLFIGAVGGIYALSYDSGYYADLREIFDSLVNCARPCFLGLQPGVTDVTKTVTLLEAHEWVEKVNISDVRLQISFSWIWNEQQPDFLISPGYIKIRNREHIDYITIPTTLHFGEIWLALGPPASGDAGRYTHIARYPDYGFFLRMPANCRRFYWEKAALNFSRSPQSDMGYDVNSIRRAMCED